MAKQKKEIQNDNSQFTDQFISELNKEFGDEVAFLISDGSPSDVKIFVPTGSKLLDYAITNRIDGGWPVGKISEITSLEGVGKTLFAMVAAANAQKMGGLVVYLDTENAFQQEFARRVGLDPENNFILMNPSTVEDVFKTIFTLVHRIEDLEKKNKESPFKFVFLVWDSVAATPCNKDLSDENPDPQSSMALKPRILSKNIGNLLKMAGRKNFGFLFINQLRMQMNTGPFSDPYIAPGGKAIPYAASVRVRLANFGKIKLKDDIVGANIKAKCVKTRFCGPYKECSVPLYFANGIDDNESIIDYLEDVGAIRAKSGGIKGKQYSFKDEDAESGVDKLTFKKKMKSDSEFKNKILSLLDKEIKVVYENPDEEETSVQELDVASGEE